MSRIVTHAKATNKPVRAEADGYDGTVGHVHAPCPPWNPRMADQNKPSWAELDKAIAVIIAGVAMQYVTDIAPVLMMGPFHRYETLAKSQDWQAWDSYTEMHRLIASIFCAAVTVAGAILYHRATEHPNRASMIFYTVYAVGVAFINYMLAWGLGHYLEYMLSDTL